ncbi:MAG TPA: substrate-binding domain-containing protein, partial [Desertimonas sp.]|nr:substrate-binding domain-containing protein [Desertimonas sp.]
MTRTKRHLAVLTSVAAAAAMAVSGTAAGTTVPPDDSAAASGSTPDDSAAATGSTPEDDLTIGFVTHVVGNPFIQQIIDAAEFAAEDLGVAIEVTGPAGGDADAQLTAAQNVVSAGADGLAVSVPGESMANGLNEIIESGVPVVQFNLLSTAVDAPYVGERSVESGRILGAQVLEMLGGAEATGQVILGNCFPGFPVLENRAVGVQEALAEASGLEILGPFDVTVDPASNYAAWESLLAANPEAVALIGLCAPDLASLGPLQEANPDSDFVAGGYDLTEDNLAAIEDGFADVAIGQTPFMQGYLPVYMLVDALRNGTELELSFVDAGTEIVTADRVIEPFGLPELTFDELLELAASPEAAREYYQPLVDGVIADWQESVEPIEAES